MPGHQLSTALAEARGCCKAGWTDELRTGLAGIPPERQLSEGEPGGAQIRQCPLPGPGEALGPRSRSTRPGRCRRAPRRSTSQPPFSRLGAAPGSTRHSAARAGEDSTTRGLPTCTSRRLWLPKKPSRTYRKHCAVRGPRALDSQCMDKSSPVATYTTASGLPHAFWS